MSTPERIARARRWLILHRRWISAVLVFASAFFALRAVSPSDARDAVTAVDAKLSMSVEEGLLELPVRLSDPSVATLLSAGDTVDVIGSQSRGPSGVVAHELVVTNVPVSNGGSAFSSSDDGLIVVAGTPEDALALADAASRGPLTVAVHP